MHGFGDGPQRVVGQHTVVFVLLATQRFSPLQASVLCLRGATGLRFAHEWKWSLVSMSSINYSEHILPYNCLQESETRRAGMIRLV